MSYEERPDTGDEDNNPFADLDAKYKGLDSLTLVRAMDGLRTNKDNLEEELKGINREYDYLRLKAIPTNFEEQGIENLKVEGIGRVSLTGDMYVSAVKAKQDEFFQWLRDRNLGSLIAETVNSSTLKAAVKQWMGKGEEVPADYVKVTPFTRASITKR